MIRGICKLCQLEKDLHQSHLLPASVLAVCSAPGLSNPHPVVSVEEISSHLGVAKDTVYRWIGSRELPAHRVGRPLKFKVSEIDHWVQVGGAGDDGNTIPNRKLRRT
jgi:excisionase family DNA binding protein